LILRKGEKENLPEDPVNMRLSGQIDLIINC